MAYATLEEFVNRLTLENPTPARLERAQQALDAAALEIDEYLGWDVEPPEEPPGTGAAALLAVVNLDRAGEHWRYTPYGTLPSGPDLPPTLVARDSWYRHARKLAGLKTSWGVA